MIVPAPSASGSVDCPGGKLRRFRLTRCVGKTSTIDESAHRYQLLRLADHRSPEHDIAEKAIEHLLASNIALFISAQVLVEFWVVATRPDSVNGLGWSTETAADAIRALRDQFPLLAESPDVLDRWFELVDRCQVAGKQAHDARLAALVVTHGIDHLLTFNTADFPQNWAVQAAHPRQFMATSAE